jgi:hypothetical protein
MSMEEAFGTLVRECTTENCKDCKGRRGYMLAIAALVGQKSLGMVEGIELVQDSDDPGCLGPDDSEVSTRNGCHPPLCRNANGGDKYYVQMKQSLIPE